MCSGPRDTCDGLTKQIRWKDEAVVVSEKNTNKKKRPLKQPPNSADVSRALCKLVVSDNNDNSDDDAVGGSKVPHDYYNKDDSRRRDALDALKELWSWAKLRDEHTPNVVEDFVDYGGIPTLLDFLARESHVCDEDDNDDSDARSVIIERATWVLVEFLFVTDRYSKTRRLGSDMVKTIVKRNGVRVLVSNIRSLAFGGKASFAIANTWRVLGRVVGKNSLKRIDREDQLVILDAANYCFEQIEKLDSKEKEKGWVMDVLRPLLFALGNAMSDAAVLTRNDYQQRNILAACLGALRWDGGRWNDNKIVLENAIFLFSLSLTRGLLTSREECESILPFCAHCLTAKSSSKSKRKEDYRIMLDGLKLLDAASSKVGETSLEKSGALEAVACCFGYGDGDTVKCKAHTVMKKFMTRTEAIASV